MTENKGKLIRKSGLKEGMPVGLGAMIGAGIFVLSTIASERAGQAAAVSYLITGLIWLPVAMIVSELATGVPRGGGVTPSSPRRWSRWPAQGRAISSRRGCWEPRPWRPRYCPSPPPTPSVRPSAGSVGWTSGRASRRSFVASMPPSSPSARSWC